jgi:hypothetical protein
VNEQVAEVCDALGAPEMVWVLTSVYSENLLPHVNTSVYETRAALDHAMREALEDSWGDMYGEELDDEIDKEMKLFVRDDTLIDGDVHWFAEHMKIRR